MSEPATTDVPDAPAARGRERILMVTPYAPWRDGIAAYALQEVISLRRQGHHVEVCSPKPSAAHHHLDLTSPRGLLALGRLARGFDRTIVQFHPDFFYAPPATPAAKVLVGAALGAALRSARRAEVRLHEIDHRWASAPDPAAPITRWMLRGAATIEVHGTEWRDRLVEQFRMPERRVTVVSHGAHFIRRTTADRASARRSLGLPPEGHVFLCIGFLAPHKGFDRAIRAFAGLAEAGAGLHVVGASRIDDPNLADHVEELRALSRATPGTEVHVGYVGDEAFDRWLVAADTVVLPYHHIWSSGVAERAALYRRPLIVSALDGLAEQLAGTEAVTLVADDRALASAMAEAIGREVDSSLVTSEPWPGDRLGVQAEVLARAAARRGGAAARRAATAPAGTAGHDPTRPLRRLRPYTPPPATSLRPGVALVKRVVRRVISWEVDPLAAQVNRLQRATLEAVDDVVDEIAEDGSRPGGAQ